MATPRSVGLLDQVSAIKAALGLPADVEGAVPVIGTANSLLGIVPEPGATLQTMARASVCPCGAYGGEEVGAWVLLYGSP